MALQSPEVYRNVTDASTQRDVPWVGFLHISFSDEHCGNKPVIGASVIDGWPKGKSLCAVYINWCKVEVLDVQFFLPLPSDYI